MHVVPPLLDDRATGAAIDALVTDELTGLGAGDSLVIFYAGHGGVRPQRVGERDVRTGYLIPVDAAADPQRVQSWIELDPWLRRISRLPPRHILVILDACFSGIALSSAIKWGRDSGALTALPFAAANLRPSRLVITSALDDERAMDSGPTPGHSLFTGCLIEALTGGLAPVGTRDGRHVTIGSELGRYLRHRVQTYAGRPGWQQTPDLGSFDFDERGEMLIPLLAGDGLATLPPRLARGSADRIAPGPAAPAAHTAAIAVSSSSADPAFADRDGEAAADTQTAMAALDVVRLASPPPATADMPDGRVLHGVAALREKALQPRRFRRWHLAVGASMIALAGALASIVTRGTGAIPDAAPRISSSEAALPREGDSARTATPTAATRHDTTSGVAPSGGQTDATDRDDGSRAAPRPPATAPRAGRTVSKAAPSPSGSPPAAPSADGASASPASSTTTADGRAGDSSPSTAREASLPPSPTAPPDAAITESAAGTDHGAAPGASKSRRRAAGAAPSAAAPPAATTAPPGGICMTTIAAGKGAEVVWNGETLPATTPLPLPCGREVSIEVLAPGHVPELKKVVADGSPKITKRLRKAEFQVYVESKPQGAKVWVGARSFGPTPTWVPLPVGKSSTLKLTKQGYKDMTHRVSPTVDGLRIELPLKPVTPPDSASSSSPLPLSSP